MKHASLRAARAGLVVAVAVLGSSAPSPAQETRILPAADRVLLHSTAEVSALPALGAAEDAAGARVRVQPRRPRNPEELQRLKESLPEGPGEVFAAPDTVVDRGPRAASSPLAVVSSFEGPANLPDNAVTGFSVVPSDANLAVGPQHVFAMVNLVGRVTNKSGGAASTFTLRSFFQADTNTTETDPRVLYDAASGRWFATLLQTGATQSSVILAASTTSDPTGTFCLFRLGDPTSEAFLQDFPQLGISDDKVIVTYNAFSVVGEMFLGAGYYVIDKADLVTGGGCPPSVSRVRVPPDASRFGVQPAQSVSSTSTLYMAMHVGPVPGGSEVDVFGVDGAPGAGTVTERSFPVNVKSWLAPPDAAQLGSAVRLTTNDESVIAAVWQRGSLWIGGNERCTPSGDAGPRSCLRLIQIQTDARSVQQDITYGAASQYYYYPAISPDGDGNLAVVFNASSTADFAGVRATGRLATDPPNTLGASILLQAGGGAQTGSGRMGDYYGAAMDPADPSKVWVTAEYVRTTADRDWGTFVAQLAFTAGLPTLALALNTHTFTTGETLHVDLTVGNPGAALSVDAYFGALLPPAAGPGVGCPMGDAVAFVATAGSSIVIRCRSASAASFPKFAAGASLPGGLPPTTLANFFDFVWPPAPAGPYTLFMWFAIPGSFDDGTIGPGDIILTASDTLTFAP